MLFSYSSVKGRFTDEASIDYWRWYWWLNRCSTASKLGYNVTIYEQNAQPGGKMNQIVSQGFTFDVGPTIVMMKDIYEEVFRFCGVDPHNYLPFEEVQPLMHLVFGDQSSLDLSRDLPTLIAEINRIAPDDVNGMLNF